jgi:hypothetical protein
MLFAVAAPQRRQHPHLHQQHLHRQVQQCEQQQQQQQQWQQQQCDSSCDSQVFPTSLTQSR